MIELPYLTDDLPGIGGLIKQRVEDFRVEEIPLYTASGEGTHVYFTVHKVSIPTPAAVERIARHMGVRNGDIGVAGLKDAQAITTQMMSLEHADTRRLAAFRDRQVQINIVGQHGNKLRTGHLAGNRFAIRIRGVGTGPLAPAGAVLKVLIARGVPNYFGPQRFGARGDTGSLGEALIKGDLDEFIARFLGRAQPNDPPDCRAARDAFDAGFYARGLDRWPRHYSNERRALSAYRKKGKAGPAVAAIDKRAKRFYVSAFQSELFNEVLARRITEIDRVRLGDLAKKSDTGGVFTVEDADKEQPRAEAFEISATGPLVGYRSRLAEGEPGQIERAVLAARSLEQEDFRRVGSLRVKGTRRALRFRLDDASLEDGRDEHGPFLEARFIASSGCYATVALREIMKAD